MGLTIKLAWVALPALAGCGMLSQVSSQGTGTNSGGNANSSSKITLNKHGLPWPENPTPTTVLKDYSWEQEFAQPGSAKNIPYYGKVTPAEIVDHINKVWNATKYIKHIPPDERTGRSETVAQLWRRIKEKVDPVIKSLGYEPTIAHKQIMYDAGIATFIATNVTYGEADQSIPGLGRNEVLSYSMNYDQSGIRHANLLLKQNHLKGVCANIVALDMALKNEAGIIAGNTSVYVRGATLVPVAKDMRLINHATVTTLYPTKNGTTKTPSQRMASPLESYSRTLSNPTAYTLSKDKSFIERVAFPFMSEFAVGAKGDDVFRVRFGAVNVAFVEHIDGSDNSKVVEFGEGGKFSFGKPLDPSFQRLFDIVDEFEENYTR